MTIEERAEYIYPVFYENGVITRFPDRNLKSRVAYIKGATEQRKIDIDKACEWFKKNYREYVLGGEDMIEAFRKAMEESK